ncbi:ParA family protein [Dysosmobacter welbionis]|uniref:ParA family protein n=1 Tax=Dysosmobacter welbionis TaxID=2093857 RepID=UPI002355612D|nr:ParA family protein [Dysosmobacter welbionis]
MKTIAIMNNKGGVGKTATAINLADILIQDYRKRVLLADCDGQMNLTRFFLPEYDPEVGYSMVSLLLGDGEPVWSDNVVPLRPGLNLVPGSLELYSLTLRPCPRARMYVRPSGCWICEAVRQDEEGGLPDLRLPAGFTAASMAALRAADEVVIPMELDGFSIYGLSHAGGATGQLAAVGAKARVAGVLITRSETRSFPEVWRYWFEAASAMSLRQRFGTRQSCRRVQRTAAPLSEYSFRSAAAVDYRRWVREYLGGELFGTPDLSRFRCSAEIGG